MSEDNPLKQIFYNKIEEIGENKIQLHIQQKKSKSVISKILEECIPKIHSFEDGFGVFATVLLHYFLTNAMIPSQRKFNKDDVEFDIIIPDFQTLLNSPQNTIILYIPLKIDKAEIDSQLDTLSKIQPNKENIWIIVENMMKTDYRIFDQSVFPTIIDEIGKFLSDHQIKRLKILKNNF